MEAANEPLPWGEVRHGFTALRKIYYRMAGGRTDRRQAY